MRERRRERAVDKRQKSFERILSWLYILFILFAAALIIHLFFIQVIDIKKYEGVQLLIQGNMIIIHIMTFRPFGNMTMVIVFMISLLMIPILK